MRLRPTGPGDAPALAAIYGHAARHGFGTFEDAAPSPEEMERRRARIAALGLPHLVAELDGRAAGFACATPFRPRAAYRFTAEDSVYVAPWAQGRGVGRALLQGVAEACEAMGLRQLVALIGDSENAGSIALHRACGFEVAGVLPAVGFKHGRWVDVVLMRRALGPGAATPAGGGGLALGED
jgi:L-amino acid N-acyltransferase YncA